MTVHILRSRAELFEIAMVWALGAAAASCGRTPLEVEGCTSDEDCSNGNVCVPSGANSICVDTSGGGSSGSASSSGVFSSGSSGSASSSGVFSSSGADIVMSSASSGSIPFGTSSGSTRIQVGSSGMVGSSSGSYSFTSSASSASSGAASSSGSQFSSSSGSVGSSASGGGVAGCSGARCFFPTLPPYPTGAGIPLDGCYQASIGSGGYAYPVVDNGGSTGCVDAANLCGTGSTASSSTSPAAWGSGYGINVGQQATWGVNDAVTPTASGLTYQVTDIPANGLRIILGTQAPPVCYELPPGAHSYGTIPWANFVTDCWNSQPQGTRFTSSEGIADIQFLVPASDVPSDWTFCVQALSF